MRRTSRNLISMLALAGALSGVAAVPAVAAPADLEAPAPGLSEGAESEVPAEAEVAGEVKPDKYITVGQNRNEATGDVLGRGSEQLIRIENGNILILENGRPGATVLKTIDAGLNTEWPAERYGQKFATPAFPGGGILAAVVKHAPSRLAVLGDRIYVSRLLMRVNGYYHLSDGSVVTEYSATTGERLNERRFEDPDHAVTALDAFMYDGKPYLAIGLNRGGVRVTRADQSQFPDYRIVHEKWDGRGKDNRDMVSVVKLGVDDYDRFVLVAGRITYDGAALVTSDLRAGSTDRHAATELWGNNWRTKDDLGSRLQWPDLISFGKLGSGTTRTQELMAVAWPSLGRVSFLDATNGIDWNWVDRPTGAHGIRFFTSYEGQGLVAIGRDHHTGRYMVGGVNEQKHLIEVDEGPVLALPGVVYSLTR